VPAPRSVPAVADSAAGAVADTSGHAGAGGGLSSPEAAGRAAAPQDTAGHGMRLARSRAAARAAQAPTPTFRQPRWVMLRSLVVPGWGQLHNGAWLKALAIAGLEGSLGARVIADERALARLSDDIDAARAAGDTERANALVDGYNARLGESVRRQWLLAGVVVYALLDAYVDAHLKSFDLELETDRARPGARGGPGGRLSVRWDF
jgi:hypothetical protein